jgi:hypothetical protein
MLMKKNMHVRRAAVVVWTAITSSVLIGFAALAIDLGYLYVVRVQLQNAADAAAMAGVTSLAAPAVLEGTLNQEEVAYLAKSRAMEYSAKNQAANRPVYLDPSDIQVGSIGDPFDLTDNSLGTTYPYNAVAVTVRMGKNTPNGPIDLFFARIWGKQTASLSATATAYLNTRVRSFEAQKETGGPVIPISVRVEKFRNDILQGLGDDAFGYDPETGQVTSHSDGIQEISIYPEKQKNYAQDNPDGAGNFGMLDIGDTSNSASDLVGQITNGLTADDFEALFGKTVMELYTETGTPEQYQASGELSLTGQYYVDGNPGLMASVKGELEARVGDVVGFFIHSEVNDPGGNAVFTIVGLQFGRVMHVDMTGSPNRKVLVIQPVTYVGPEIVTSPEAPIHETAGSLSLIR